MCYLSHDVVSAVPVKREHHKVQSEDLGTKYLRILTLESQKWGYLERFERRTDIMFLQAIFFIVCYVILTQFCVKAGIGGQ